VKELKVLFLGKAEDECTVKALKYTKMVFSNVEAHLGIWGDKLPDSAKNWEGDLIISYLSRWVVPKYLIDQAKIAAINFHPAPPNYPGIGCNNFALYNDEKLYGITCHHMSEKLDAGAIIQVKEFPIFPSDDVESLLGRVYDYQLILFFEVINDFTKSGEFSESSRTWTRLPYTRKEFDKLFEVTLDMDSAEVNRRIRAISFGQYQPHIFIHGKKFLYIDETS
jgi:methionyl-tRNA formyltransferase